MKVMISSLLIIVFSLAGLAVVEWLPRMASPVTPAYAAGFAIYPDLPSPVPATVDVNDAVGIEGSVSEIETEEKLVDVQESIATTLPEDDTESSVQLGLQKQARSKKSEMSVNKPERQSDSQSQQSTRAASRPSTVDNSVDNSRANQVIAWAGQKNTVQIQAQQQQARQQVVRSRPSQQPRQQAAVLTTGLTVQVMSAAQKQPVKANVYIQRENGVNVSRKRYVERARFALKPGRYKVTVRADGHQDLVRSVYVGHQALQQTFALQRQHQPRQSRQQPRQQAQQQQPHRAGRQHHSRQNQQRKIQQAAARQAAARQAVRHEPSRHVEPVRPRPPVARHGRLQLHAVSATDGQPLAVNFRITSVGGKTLHHAPGVAYAEMSVPVGQVRIHIDHQGLAGSEVAQIQANATTAHTFSVVPPSKQVAAAHTGGQRYVTRPRLGLGVGIGPLVFRIR